MPACRPVGVPGARGEGPCRLRPAMHPAWPRCSTDHVESTVAQARRAPSARPATQGRLSAWPRCSTDHVESTVAQARRAPSARPATQGRLSAWPCCSTDHVESTVAQARRAPSARPATQGRLSARWRPRAAAALLRPLRRTGVHHGLLVALLAAACTGPATDPQGATVLRSLETRAEQGAAEAQADLGARYLLGDGVPRDPEEALRWYRMAAEQGYAPAQATLGDLYLNGEAVSQDDGEATRWYRMAAEQGQRRRTVRAGIPLRSRPGGWSSTRPRRRG